MRASERKTVILKHPLDPTVRFLGSVVETVEVSGALAVGSREARILEEVAAVGCSPNSTSRRPTSSWVAIQSPIAPEERGSATPRP